MCLLQNESIDEKVKNIKVSVIVATYRRDESLKRALESLINQSYDNIEVIVVDDNAEEKWNEKVKNIIDKINVVQNIIYIKNEINKGSAETRNTGIKVASGEYITFLDDDDIYLPEKIKKQVEFMKNGYDYSITDLNLFNRKGHLIDRRVRSYIKDTSKEAILKYNLKYHLTGTDTMMFTKEYLERIGGFAHIDVGDEFYLMQRAIEGGGKFGYLPGCEIKAYIHTGEGGISSGDGKIKGENALYEYKKKYFDKIDTQTRRYIRMRHYAVIAFAEIRRKKLLAFMINALKSFFCAPISCFKILFWER